MSDDTSTRSPMPTGGEHEVPNPYSLERAPVEHHARQTDISERARKRAARQVAVQFGLSGICVVLFFLAFIWIDPTDVLILPYIGPIGTLHVTLGVTFGLAIFLIGTGAVHWAKKLMSDVEVIQERHEYKSSPEDTAGALEVYEEGVEASVWKQHPIIRRTLLLATALVPLPFIISLRDLWITPPGVDAPSQMLETTIWDTGIRLVGDLNNLPIRPEDIPVGGLVNINPENLEEIEHAQGSLNARAKAAAIVIRMPLDEIQSVQIEDGTVDGIVAFSKICTHVGCPIALYQQRTHELLCPCHQSTFLMSDSANVVFGPAARRLPQLPIEVNDDGYLVAKSDFLEPVGPSFWELKGD